ncbi:hypothetical protein F4780DRAFT_471988 [Xylariomycetidae sp. FL0641]|nr:hypothetical protein F4780DRAFT_471988 [Xylariomycetidae sp. FL0641]
MRRSESQIAPANWHKVGKDLPKRCPLIKLGEPLDFSETATRFALTRAPESGEMTHLAEDLQSRTFAVLSSCQFLITWSPRFLGSVVSTRRILLYYMTTGRMTLPPSPAQRLRGSRSVYSLLITDATGIDIECPVMVVPKLTTRVRRDESGGNVNSDDSEDDGSDRVTYGSDDLTFSSSDLITHRENRCLFHWVQVSILRCDGSSITSKTPHAIAD